MNERSFIVKPALRFSTTLLPELALHRSSPRWPTTCRSRRAACSRSPSKRAESKLSAPCHHASSRGARACSPLTPACCRRAPATASSGFVCEAHVGLLMRHNRRRLRCRVPPSKGIRRRLADELQDCCGYTQNAGGKNRCFHDAPALLFRADQKRVCRFRFVVHNFKTPRSCRFV